MSDTLIASVIYMAVLAQRVIFALRPGTLVMSDQQWEYQVFLRVKEIGKPRQVMRENNSVVSLFLTIILPYYISKVTKLPGELIFRVLPCFFYAAMPAFIYLISRQYLSFGYSILTVVFVLSHYLFAFSPNTDRASVGFGYLSALSWAFLTGHTLIATILASTIVLSHYSTAYYALLVWGLAWFIFFIAGATDSMFIALSAILVMLVLTIWVYYSFFASHAGAACQRIIRESVTMKGWKEAPINQRLGKPEVTVNPVPTISPVIAKRIPVVIPVVSNVERIIARQEPVVRIAFGWGFRALSIPRKLEFFTSWLLIIFWMLGIVTAGINGIVPIYHVTLIVLSFLVIILSIIVPSLSIFNGVVRPYFSSLAFSAPCFTFGVLALSNFLDWNGYILASAILIPHIFTVSGMFHRVLGRDKRKMVEECAEVAHEEGRRRKWYP